MITQFASILAKIPVIINGNYGDAFLPKQWKDTTEKLKMLRENGHNGPVMVPTKIAPSAGQVEELCSIDPEVWIFMAITGLNESPLCTLEPVLQSYREACQISRRTVCALRPIIQGKNDHMDVLAPILDTVREHGRKLTFAGVRDRSHLGSRKYQNVELSKLLYQYGLDNDVLVKEHCACIIAASTGEECVIHEAPRGKSDERLELVKYFGYRVRKQGKWILEGHQKGTLSKGDKEFVKMLIGPVYTESVTPSEVLSFLGPEGQSLVCTSSWFAWSRQIYCDVDCAYCFAAPSSAVRIPLVKFGCLPTQLEELIRPLLDGNTR